MAKTTAERQKEFRERNKGKTRKLEVLLPGDEFTLLHDNAKQKGLTKAKYVVSLLHDNSGENGTVQGNNAIDLIQENKRLAKDNAQLTIKANEEHISRVSLEAKHDKQIKGLNNLIYKLNDKPLAGRCDELETEVTALKNQISNHTHTSQEYALLESENKILTAKVEGLEDVNARANDSIAKMLKSNTLTSMANNYDGYGSLHSAVVDLIGCPASAKSSTNKFIKAAVDALGIKKIGNKYSTEQRKQMYDWIEALPVITKQVREI